MPFAIPFPHRLSFSCQILRLYLVVCAKMSLQFYAPEADEGSHCLFQIIAVYATLLVTLSNFEESSSNCLTTFHNNEAVSKKHTRLLIWLLLISMSSPFQIVRTPCEQGCPDNLPTPIVSYAENCFKF
jgi:hypothetical protein